MLPYPAFDKIAFEIGPFGDFGPLKVHWYGIMYLVAFAAAWWLARVRAKKPGSTWKPVDIDDFMFFGMLGTILGGRLGYVLFYGLSYWAEDPWYPFKIWDGGMSFHGGLLGVIIAFAIFAVRRKRRIADVFDFAAPLPGIGISRGAHRQLHQRRVVGQDPPTCRGVSWSTAKSATRRSSTRPRSRALVLFVILWWYTSKPRPRMAPAGLFLIIYSLARIIVEFWRVPDEHMSYLAGGWLTMGMLLSLPMLLIGAHAHVHGVSPARDHRETSPPSLREG